MSNLNNQSIVVAGGAGEVGEGIVAALLEQGASVLVPSRSGEKIAALQAAVGSLGSGRLSVLEADIGTEAGRAGLRSAAEAMGPLRAVVVSLGEFWQGPLVVDLPRRSLDDVLEQRLFSHLSVAQTLMPLLHGPGSSLIQINGLAAVVAIPGLSALHISTAAQLALTRCLIAEADADSPLITTLLIEQWVKTRSRQELPEDALTAREVGNEVARIILNATSHSILNLGKSEGQTYVALLSPPAVSSSAEQVVNELSGS